MIVAVGVQMVEDEDLLAVRMSNIRRHLSVEGKSSDHKVVRVGEGFDSRHTLSPLKEVVTEVWVGTALGHRRGDILSKSRPCTSDIWPNQ